MIRLQKTPIPAELTKKIQERTERYLALSTSGTPIPAALEGAYKAPEVKDLLRKETFDKCAYCESKIPHVDYGDVEHIIPKSRRPELRYEYQNLTYACGVCNTKKGDYYDENTPLLNPYSDDVENHLVAFGPMIIRVPASDRGLLTEKKLDLNRPPLVERRKERLEAIATLVDQIPKTTNLAIRETLIDQLNKECESNKEYALTVRSYVESVRGHLK